jgi:Rrf2 family iron-sulfur cluster assembly transcriptional regulator
MAELGVRSPLRGLGDNLRWRIMKLTRAASYAIHAVAFMAVQKDKEKPVASHHIAQARGIPERFLLKVLKPLVTARVLTSIKGPNGGYRLARRLNAISVLEVIEAVDGPIHGTAPGGRETPLNGKLTAICTQSAGQVRKLLEKVKLSDLVKK